MAHDICTTAPTHTLFLGCSVVSFTANVGFNEQATTMSITLVEDPCDGDKTYYNSAFAATSWTDPDPGFFGETNDIIGAPAYFRVDDFEFCGLIQSWEKQESEGGTLYQVQLIDPRAVLEGTQCIINDYAGSVRDTSVFGGIYGPYNVFNLYGLMESLLGVSCPQYSLNYSLLPGNTTYVSGNLPPDGPVFGTDSNAFGGARVSDAGMPWSYIAYALDVACNSSAGLTSDFSPAGRIVFRGTSSTLTTPYMGLINSIADPLGAIGGDGGSTGRVNIYFVDLTEIPTPPDDWRINETSISIMDMVNRLCSEYGYDYYIELLPVYHISGICLFIKVRIVDRSSSPTYGKIQSFINSVTNDVDSSVGVELRNEDTSSILIGGNKQTVYQMLSYNDPEDDTPNDPTGLLGEFVTEDDITLPYFGVNNDGSTIIPGYNNTSGWYINVETSGINNELQYYTFPTATVTIEELELRSALEGMDEWMSTASYLNTDCGALFNTTDGGRFARANLLDMINATTGNNRLTARDMLVSNGLALQADPNEDLYSVQKAEDIDSIYNWVGGLAKNFGQKYQVRVPFTCPRLETDSNRVMYSEEPSDGGWTDQPYVLGLPISGTPLNGFLLPDGRLGNFAVFSMASGLNVSDLDHDSYIIENDYLYVKIDIEPDYVFHYVDPTNTNPPQVPRVICSLPAPIHYRNDIYNNLYRKSHGYLFGLINRAVPELKQAYYDSIKHVLAKTGGRSLMVPLMPPLFLPLGWAIGIRSNVLRYGPWIYRGPAGKVRVEKDDSLVPWEYNGWWALNAAAIIKAQASLTYMQKGEKGHITVPGYPSVPLGAELEAINDGYTTYLYGGRSVSVNTRGAIPCWYVDMSPPGGGLRWTGSSGPNVSDISVSVGPDGAKTTYNMNTFTPRFGRLAKYNSDRLKRISDRSAEANFRFHKANWQRTNSGFLKSNRRHIK